MRRDRKFAEAEGFDYFAFPLLCRAKAFEKHLARAGFECFLFTETTGTHAFTVYYLAHRKAARLTRRERGLMC